MAILPLLISAAEYYEDAIRPISRYRTYGSEIKIYQQRLQTQQAIFRAECQLLLESLIGEGVAADVLDRLDDPLWTDREAEDRLISQLRPSGEACEVMVKLIVGKLKTISKEFVRLAIAVSGLIGTNIRRDTVINY